MRLWEGVGVGVSVWEQDGHGRHDARVQARKYYWMDTLVCVDRQRQTHRASLGFRARLITGQKAFELFETPNRDRPHWLAAAALESSGTRARSLASSHYAIRTAAARTNRQRPSAIPRHDARPPPPSPIRPRQRTATGRLPPPPPPSTASVRFHQMVLPTRGPPCTVEID